MRVIPRPGKRPAGPPAPTPLRRSRLVLLSFLMLFVELALIRWTASNVLYLAYFTNFVLLASFLGIGVGFLRARSARDLFPAAPVALASVVAFVLAFPVQASDRAGERRLVGLLGMPALPAWIVLPLLFVGTTAVMAMIAEGVARTFVRFEPLEAYRLDIVGSIAGIAVFSALSFAGAPPLAWGAVAAACLAALIRRPTRLQWAAMGVLALLLGIESLVPAYSWSPYYRVAVWRPAPDGTIGISVNNIPHQSMVPLAKLTSAHAFYFLPYQHTPTNPLTDVLIVGAGTGNDVAVALSRGAKHVDAVEIDPRLYRIGVERHPNHPYQDPRVTAHIDDGRAFLERSHTRYDLILFALPDSLTLVSGQSSLRLESYLFTVEAMRSARAHLRPGGVFAVYNYYRTPVFERFAGTLDSVYGHPPCVDRRAASEFRRQTVLTIGLRPDSVACATLWRPLADAPAPATDDHPFPYLEGRAIPAFYVITLLLILAGAVLIVRAASGPLGDMRQYVDLAFMGAAFLLLETKNVVQFALLFGTTWFVNALVFTGILLTVLAAVEVALRVRPLAPGLLYGALLAALVVAWIIPPHDLLSLPTLPRFALATALAFSPIFLANLVFAQRFKSVASSGVAFGANLLGAMAGGVLEYLALVVGYRSLLLVVAVLYGLAFLTGRRHLMAKPRT